MNKSILALAILSINLPVFIYSMTPNEQLMEAIDHNNLQQVQAALDAGACVNCNNSGCTALHLAAHWGNDAIVRLLLEHGACVDSKAGNGYTPLHVAIDNLPVDSFNNIVIALIAANANVNAQNNYGWTPLHMAAQHSINTAKLLLECGADQTLKDTSGTTALGIAKKFGNQEMIKLLSEVPSLRNLSARTIRKLIRQKQLTLEQVKNSIPVDLHDSIKAANSNE